MQTGEINRLRRLEAGQLWKLEQGYVYIVEVAARIIHYKTLRHPDQTAAITRLIGIEALLNYFRQTEAELMFDGGTGTSSCHGVGIRGAEVLGRIQPRQPCATMSPG